MVHLRIGQVSRPTDALRDTDLHAPAPTNVRLTLVGGVLAKCFSPPVQRFHVQFGHLPVEEPSMYSTLQPSVPVFSQTLLGPVPPLTMYHCR